MTKAELIAENEELKIENAALKKEVARLEEALQEALAQLEASQRSKRRQAAPFRREGKKEKPKRPGRKKGHQAAHREKPERVDRVIEVVLEEDHCAECGGELIERRVEEQYQIDIPPVRPVVTQFNIEVACCGECGKRVQARHPEQTSDALGAAAVQIGPRAMALAAEMKHALGIPYRKICRVLEEGFGLRVSPGTLSRGGQRLATKSEPTYEQLVHSIREQEVVYGDETGWRIAAENAWLWVFTSDEATVYTIDRRRSHEVAERILGSDFEGVLSCDCFAAYDPLPYRQQKCLAHLLRRCSDIASAPHPAETIQLSQQVAWVLRMAMELKARRHSSSSISYQQNCQLMEDTLDKILDEAGEPEEDAARRLVKLLRKQRSRLFTFLYVDKCDPTNNAAERAIRPAVIVRKTSAGNKGKPGARTHAIITSLWQTCQQQTLDFLALVAYILRHQQPQTIEFSSFEPPSEPILVV